MAVSDWAGRKGGRGRFLLPHSFLLPFASALGTSIKDVCKFFRSSDPSAFHADFRYGLFSIWAVSQAPSRLSANVLYEWYLSSHVLVAFFCHGAGDPMIPSLPVSSSHTASNPRSTYTSIRDDGHRKWVFTRARKLPSLPLPARDMFHTMESQSLAVGLQDMHYSFNGMQLRAAKNTLMQLREEVIG